MSEPENNNDSGDAEEDKEVENIVERTPSMNIENRPPRRSLTPMPLDYESHEIPWTSGEENQSFAPIKNFHTERSRRLRTKNRQGPAYERPTGVHMIPIARFGCNFACRQHRRNSSYRESTSLPGSSSSSNPLPQRAGNRLTEQTNQTQPNDGDTEVEELIFAFDSLDPQ